MTLIVLLAIILVISIIAVLAVAFLMHQSEKFESENYTNKLEAINTSAQLEKEENKREILTMFDYDKELTTQEIVERLSVSRATAYRYLEELEQTGKIKQIGKKGKDVHYIKI